MTSFVAIYRGQSVAEARLIAVSADPNLVSDVSIRLLQNTPAFNQDPVIETFENGRRAALRLIEREAVGANDFTSPK